VTTTETTPQTATETAGDTLYRTADGQRAHLRGCPHIVGLEVVPIAAGDTTVPTCRWSWTELSGVGRIPQRSVDSGLRELGVSPTNRPAMVKLLKGVPWDDVHLPPSRAYLALSLEGRSVAWAGKTYLQIGEQYLPMPDHRTGTTTVSELWGEPCDDCFQARARNGTCNCG
jgi:hypothetical protein